MKSFKSLLITSLLLTFSFAKAADETSIGVTKASLPSALQSSQRAFRIEASGNSSTTGSGEAIYLSYGGNFGFKTGLRKQNFERNYNYFSYTDYSTNFETKKLAVTYLEIPFYVNMESADSLFYSNMGFFYAIPQDAKFGSSDAQSIVQSNFNFQVEIGLRWQFKPLALKVGFSTTSGLDSVTSNKSIENTYRSDSAVTAGISFTL